MRLSVLRQAPIFRYPSEEPPAAGHLGKGLRCVRFLPLRLGFSQQRIYVIMRGAVCWVLLPRRQLVGRFRFAP